MLGGNSRDLSRLRTDLVRRWPDDVCKMFSPPKASCENDQNLLFGRGLSGEPAEGS